MSEASPRLESVLAQGGRDHDEPTGSISCPIYQTATFRHAALGESAVAGATMNPQKSRTRKTESTVGIHDRSRVRIVEMLAVEWLALPADIDGHLVVAGLLGFSMVASTAAWIAKATFLLVYADTTSGSLGTTDEEKAALSCVQKNRFPQGESIVWRVRVIDPATGKPMTDKDVKTVTLTFPDGTTKDMKFGPHPKGKTDDYFWAASFKIPADYPTGAFKYKVLATSNEGVTGSFDQFNVASSLLQVIKAGTR